MGYEVNWHSSQGNQRLMLHPLYIKYSSSTLGTIAVGDVRNDLSGVIATAESSEICWYLSWLIRTRILLGDD